MPNNLIDLDASKWSTTLDFYKDILAQVGAPDWHGESVAALVDSIIYGGINTKIPPFRIRVSGTACLKSEVLDEVRAAKEALDSARRYNRESTGCDIDVEFDVD